ncbi:hypothetical protein [Lacinutrix himadriensis]|uniref:hypothetical protein n=1 Tax=Lacinutrix himadriensis TaxID=641549 RepID=UPI0006E3D849|nr:hypothetical protein [Lacinutrix himadriensis]
MTDKFNIKVKVNSDRPDFRIFASYFFGNDLYNYDSEGNSIPVTSKNWTELYMSSRNNSDLNFDIWPINENPLILEVTSGNVENVYRAAYFLARETNGEIINEKDEIQSLENLIEKMGDFNLKERLLIADKSVWRKATEENPYPNLNNE